MNRRSHGFRKIGLAHRECPCGNREQVNDKSALIEDDGETAEEITAEMTDRGFEVELSANLDKAVRGGPTP